MYSTSKVPRPAAWLFMVLGTLSASAGAATLSVSELSKSGNADGTVLLTLKSDTPPPSSVLLDLKFDGSSLTVTPPSSVLVPSALSSGSSAVVGDDFRVDSSLIGGGTLAGGTSGASGLRSGTLRLVISSSKKDAVLRDGTTFRVPVRTVNGQAISNGFPVTIKSVSSEVGVGSLSVGALVTIGPSARISSLTAGGTVNAAAGPQALKIESLNSTAGAVTEVRYFSEDVELASGTLASWRPLSSGSWSVFALVKYASGAVVRTHPVDFNVTGVANQVVAATYTGAVLDAGSQKLARGMGSVQITTTATPSYGGYSLRMILEGRSYSASGRFDLNSVATPTFPVNIAGRPKLLRMRLEQGAVSSADSISGLVTDGTIDSVGAVSGGSLLSRFVADRVVWVRGKKEYNASNAGLPGRYNATLSDLSAPNVGVNGTGILNVSSLGVASGQFRMFDGSRATGSGYLSKRGVWQPYASLAGGAGYLVGHLDFSDQDRAGMMGGDAIWRRNATVFSSLGVDGGTFIASPTQPVFAVKPGASNVLLRFTGGGLSAPIEQHGTYAKNVLTMPTAISANPSEARVVLNASSGIFSGSFRPVGDRLTLSFSGVVLQGDLRADATFLRGGTLGNVSLTPVP